MTDFTTVPLAEGHRSAFFTYTQTDPNAAPMSEAFDEFLQFSEGAHSATLVAVGADGTILGVLRAGAHETEEFADITCAIVDAISTQDAEVLTGMLAALPDALKAKNFQLVLGNIDDGLINFFDDAEWTLFETETGVAWTGVNDGGQTRFFEVPVDENRSLGRLILNFDTPTWSYEAPENREDTTLRLSAVNDGLNEFRTELDGFPNTFEDAVLVY